MTVPIATAARKEGFGKFPTTAVSTAPSNGVVMVESVKGIANAR